MLEIVNLAALLVATGVAWRQLTLLRRQQAAEGLRRRRGRALEYSITRAPHLREFREQVDRVFPPSEWSAGAVPMDGLLAAFEEQDGLQGALIGLLAHWENLGLTVAAGVTDEDMAFDMVATTLVSYVDRFQAFIDHRREEGNERVYAYLIRLARRWRSRLDAGEMRPLFTD